VDAAVQRLRACGFDAQGHVALDIQPARAILDTARDVGADLIAIATHGRGPIGRFLIGSVADKVLRAAEIPAMVQHVPETALLRDARVDHGLTEPASPGADR
jgi:nucleotide-binding universal stress UspA family protein